MNHEEEELDGGYGLEDPRKIVHTAVLADDEGWIYAVIRTYEDGCRELWAESTPLIHDTDSPWFPVADVLSKGPAMLLHDQTYYNEEMMFARLRQRVWELLPLES